MVECIQNPIVNFRNGFLMLEMLSYNPLLIVAGAIISVELFVLFTMLLMLIFSYGFQTVVEDPHGHYALAKTAAKKSVDVAKERSVEAGHTLAHAPTKFVRNATSFDYRKSISAAGTQLYRLALDTATTHTKPATAGTRLEMPTQGMRVIAPSEITFTKEAPSRPLPPVPSRKPKIALESVVPEKPKDSPKNISKFSEIQVDKKKSGKLLLKHGKRG